MAIQTRGFGVDVMPHYTAVDPSLVAFNPAQVTQGISESMKLSDLFNKIRVSKQAQAELDATREARLRNIIASANAGTTKAESDIRLTPAQELAKQAEYKYLEGLFPAKGKAELADLGRIVDTAAKRTEAENAGYDITSQTAKGNIEATNARNQFTAATSPMLAQLSLADTASKLSMIPETTNLAHIKIADQIKNADLDQKIARGTSAANLDKELAAAEELRARGAYQTAHAEHINDPINNTIMAIKASNEQYKIASKAYTDLARMKVDDPAHPGSGGQTDLAQLADIAYDLAPDGTYKEREGWFRRNPISPATKNLLDQLNAARVDMNDAAKAFRSGQRKLVKLHAESTDGAETAPESPVKVDAIWDAKTNSWKKP